jgi:ADP-heptose:LPS heptosyltransferase
MFHNAIRYHPAIRSVINYPLEAPLVNNYRRVIWLENAVEFNNTDHIADCFLAAAGYDPSQIPDDQKRPEYHMPKVPVDVVPRGTKQRIGIQCKASARCRTSTQTGAYIAALQKEGYEVVLFGRHGEITCDVAGVINLAEKDLALHETGRWMQTCTAFLAPDSGLLHMANALRVPSVGLFSVIEAKLRMGYAPFCIAVQARAPCAPCHWHGRGGAFPPHCPTASKGVCGPLEAIKPELVVQAIRQVIENKRAWKKQIEGGIV